MKVIYRILFFLHALIGLGGMAGGTAAILNPVSPMGLSVDILKNSPFDNFLIPGIILFIVIGIGNVIGAVTIQRKSRFQGYISGILGGTLVIWIVVQCIMLRSVAFLHVLFFIFGLIHAALAVIILFNKRMFPANIIIGFYNRMKKEA